MISCTGGGHLPLAPGTRLGPYEIVEAIGAGGMGEVFRARDTRLERDVAIKILPQHLSTDLDLKARFKREAKAVAALQHPHICVLHDVGSENGLDFIVMEFLEGETLATRLQRKMLSRRETLQIAIEMAEALNRAHRNGIAHRDLKPGNIMLTKSGAKLMDFGLAKCIALPAPAESAPPTFSAAATMLSRTSPLTVAGTLVGTVQYMSPEQIQGKQADERSDVFAFGALLYEMLTGKRAFEGKSQLSIASAILEKEPPPISASQPLMPASLEHLVRRALEKDPDARWQSMSDIRGELQWISQSEGREHQESAVSKNRSWGTLFYAAITVLVAMGLLYFAIQSRRRPELPLFKLSVLPPQDGGFAFYGDNGSEPLLSPDGKHLAFAAIVNGKQALYVRDLESEAPRLLTGTEGGRFPFWSPDSKQLGYFAGERMLKLDLENGISTELTKVSNPRGGSWGPKGFILFAPDFRSAIYAVPVNGGPARPVTRIDTANHTSHRWPMFLPDGEHFIFLAANHRLPTDVKNALYISSLSGENPKQLIDSGCNGAVEGSSLFFCRGNKLYAQAIGRSFEMTGEPHVLAPSIMVDSSTWRAMFSVTAGGLLAYAPGSQIPGSELARFDRNGKRLGRVGEVRDYLVLSSSRDGKKVAAEVAEPTSSIWIADTQANVFSRLTFAGISTRQPVISPDGTNVAFASDINGREAVLRKATNGLGGEETLVTENDATPNDWSSDGKYLMIQAADPGLAYGLFALELSGSRNLVPLFRVPGQQVYDGSFSPDMKWFLYTLPENGREEVFVSPLALAADPKATVVKPTASWQVSSAGGSLGQWSRDGREIYYISDGKMMSVAVRSTPSFQAGAPKQLFPVAIKNLVGMPYAVTSEGKFIVNTVLQPPSSPINLISDWHKLLK